MSELELRTTNIFTKNLEAFENTDIRYIINQGGSRSSKTYSILQLLIYKCLVIPNYKISIIRKSFPALRGSVYKDFIDILTDLKIYDEKYHNKTENIYRFFNNSYVEFFSLDDSQKLRGRKRDVAYCNESNELDLEEFLQIDMRTSDKIIMDFNPSDIDSYIDDYIKKPNAILIKSTYKDNSFLTKGIIQTIEDLINVDYNYYLIYNLGEKPTSNARIYNHFKQYTDDPKKEDIKKVIYGCDVGFTNPSTLVQVIITKDDKYYCRELIYQKGLTTNDLIKEFNKFNIGTNPIYCDSAAASTIEDLKRSGYNAKSSNKFVKEGIDFIKSKQMFIHYESVNIIKEIKTYSWKTRDETILEEVVKIADHGLDGIRYCCFTDYKSPSSESFDFYVYK